MGSALCVNSGNSYAGLAELVAGEAGAHVGNGDVVVALSGTCSSSATFNVADFDSLRLIAVDGESFNPKDSTGARQAAQLTVTCPLVIDGVSIEELSCVYPATQVLNSEIKALGDYGVTYGKTNTIYLYNSIIRDTYRGTYATGANPNATAENCTLVNNANLGFLRLNCINTVVIDCGSTNYFSPVSKVNTWGEDASADNLLAEGYATFVDFDNGDVRIRANSDAGLAGAGAFIEVDEGGGSDIEIPSSETLNLQELSALDGDFALASSENLGLQELSSLSATIALDSSETLALAELSDLSVDIALGSSETLSLNESSSLALDAAFASEETLNMSEASTLVIDGQELSFSSTENLAMQELSRIDADLALASSETLSLSESSQLDVELSLSSLELLDLSELSTLSGDFALDSSEVLALQETALLGLTLDFSSTENVLLNELSTLAFYTQLPFEVLLGYLFTDAVSGSLEVVPISEAKLFTDTINGVLH